MSNARGFTLIEILVSVAIFAVIVIGAIGVLGAADVGGFLEGFPSGIITARVARDTTAASNYLQSFQEFAASKDDASLPEGDFCEPVGCGGTPISSIASLTGFPMPPGQDYQLDWQRLDVTIDRWYWDDVDTDGAGPDRGKVYCDPDADPDPYVEYAGCALDIDTSKEFLTQIRAKLTWRLRGVDRTIEVERFLP